MCTESSQSYIITHIPLHHLQWYRGRMLILSQYNTIGYFYMCQKLSNSQLNLLTEPKTEKYGKEMKTKTDLLCKNGLGDSSTVCTKELKALASTSETITRQGCHPSRFWRGRPVFHPFCPVEIPNRTSNIPFSDLTVRSGYSQYTVTEHDVKIEYSFSTWQSQSLTQSMCQSLQSGVSISIMRESVPTIDITMYKLWSCWWRHFAPHRSSVL